MGICSDKELTPEEEQEKKNKARSKKIDKGLHKDEKQDKQVNKLLLLGAGASGKSTLFKQMHILYVGEFQEEEREKYTPTVHSNVMVGIQVLCENSKIFGARENGDIYQLNPELEIYADEILELKEETALTPPIAEKIHKLWKNDAIQNTYKERAKFQLNDSSVYFFEKVKALAQQDYIPSEQDVLRTRVATTGIVENQFDIDGNIFKMFDVGGQRSERKKWIHCFENVTAVLFVAAISAYNQVLYEDENQNRMRESLTLFDEIVTTEWFSNTAIILFLNKKDIFTEKLKETRLEDYFPQFQPTNSKTPETLEEVKLYYTEAEYFVSDMFEQKCTYCYTHVTVATDSTNIFKVFQAVKDIVIKKGLERAGLT